MARRVATWVLIVPVALVLMVQARSVPTYALIAFGTWFTAYFVLGGTRGTVLPLLTVVALGLALLWLVASPASSYRAAYDAPPRRPSWPRRSPRGAPGPPPPCAPPPPVPDGARATAHDDAPAMDHR